MIPHQISDAGKRNLPRGNFSDLYPHWVGTRELLLHGRDPYSPEVTREIQEGYYGRSLDPARTDEPKDQQGFAYPVYVAFYLAPTIHFRFEVVRRAAFWFFLALTLATIPVWLRVLRWPLPLPAHVSLMVFTVGNVTAVMGLMLQQLTLVVAALVAVALAFLVSGYPVAAGILLALATIKPQLLWLLLLWLMVWTLADWRRRYRWAASFVFTMVVLAVASEFFLPHWIFRFFEAMRRYLHYTDAVSVLERMLPVPLGLISEVAVAGATAYVGWKNRQFAEGTPEFAAMAALVLAVTIIVIPSYAMYNQIMLLPAVLLLLRDRKAIWRRNRPNRVLVVAVAIVLWWPWVSSSALAGLSFVLPRGTVESAWAVPLWTVLLLPVVVAALVLIASYQGSFTTSARAGSS
jgi:hypothetical protein